MSYEGFGPIRTYTYLTAGGTAPKAEAVEHLYANRGRALVTGIRLLVRGYLIVIQILLSRRSTTKYRNIGEIRIRPLARATRLVRAVVLAPLLIPLGAGVQAYRALSRNTLATRRRRA